MNLGEKIIEQEKLDNIEYIKYDSICIELKRRKESMILKVKIAFTSGKEGDTMSGMGARDIVACFKA